MSVHIEKHPHIDIDLVLFSCNLPPPPLKAASNIGNLTTELETTHRNLLLGDSSTTVTSSAIDALWETPFVWVCMVMCLCRLMFQVRKPIGSSTAPTFPLGDTKTGWAAAADLELLNLWDAGHELIQHVEVVAALPHPLSSTNVTARSLEAWMQPSNSPPFFPYSPSSIGQHADTWFTFANTNNITDAFIVASYLYQDIAEGVSLSRH